MRAHRQTGRSRGRPAGSAENTAKAETWIRAQLANEDKPALEIKRLVSGTDLGFSLATLRLVKRKLGIHSYSPVDGKAIRTWYWTTRTKAEVEFIRRKQLEAQIEARQKQFREEQIIKTLYPNFSGGTPEYILNPNCYIPRGNSLALDADDNRRKRRFQLHEILGVGPGRMPCQILFPSDDVEQIKHIRSCDICRNYFSDDPQLPEDESPF